MVKFYYAYDRKIDRVVPHAKIKGKLVSMVTGEVYEEESQFWEKRSKWVSDKLAEKKKKLGIKED